MNMTRAEIIDSINSGTLLFELVKALKTNHDNETSIINLLCQLHNDKNIDLLEEFLKFDYANKDIDHFEIEYAFSQILPKVDSPVTSVLRCMKHLSPKSLNVQLINPFEKFLEVDIERAKEALKVMEREQYFDFTGCVFIAGSKVDIDWVIQEAIYWATKDNKIVARIAISSLGQIDYPHVELIETVLSSFESLLANGLEEIEVYQAILSSLSKLSKKCEGLDLRIVTLVERIFAIPHESLVLEASRAFAFDSRNLSKLLIDKLLCILDGVNPENKDVVRNLDIGLANLIRQDMFDEAVEFIEKLFIKTEYTISITDFESFGYTITEKEEFFIRLITRWLLSMVTWLGRFAFEILPVNEQPLKADVAQLQDGPEGLRVVLARKACGWFYTREIAVTSFILSLIDGATENEIAEIEKILFYPLLISYPGHLKEYLEKAHKAVLPPFFSPKSKLVFL